MSAVRPPAPDIVPMPGRHDAGRSTPGGSTLGRSALGRSALGPGISVLAAGALLAGGLALATPATAAPLRASAALGITAGRLATSTPADAADEARFVSLLNQRRASVGAAPVAVRADMTTVARAWSRSMASRDRLSHNPGMFGALEISGWRVLSENVGVGYSVDSLDTAFWNSPEHRVNLVDPLVSGVGVGVATLPDGKMYVTVDFRAMWPKAAPPTPAIPKPAAPRSPAAVRARSLAGVAVSRSGSKVHVFGAVKAYDATHRTFPAWSGHPVQIQRWTAHGWAPLRTLRADRRGHVDLTVRIPWRVGLRLVSPKTSTVAGAVSTSAVV